MSDGRIHEHGMSSYFVESVEPEAASRQRPLINRTGCSGKK
jgi:hypothetical protein